jgi:membrane-associated protease RseP (regulator of RpoE activity)
VNGTLAIVLFVVAILLVILIHEAAHFGMAKLFKIKVEEFFIGFGPRLWSFRRGETEYGVKALPLGGYVRIAGMNPFKEPTPEEYPRTFGAKPIWQRALVIVAGPATHFVVAFALLAAFLAYSGDPTKPRIAAVEQTLGGRPTPATIAGLRPGDRIVAIDGITNPSTVQVIDYTYAHAGDPTRLVVRRGGHEIVRIVTPIPSKVPGVKHRVGRVGVSLGPTKSGFVSSLNGGGVYLGKAVWATLGNLGRVFGPEGIGRILDLLFGSAQRRPTDVTSVVGVGRAVGQAAGDPFLVLFILASVNVFVGILNLVPLPPFDGGHLAVLAYEKIRRRKVDMRRLVPVTAVVAAFLMLFMVSVLYLDIVKPIPNVFR